ncbi:MAG TPA: efflux RND transporter periplasmic adaptor subunit [Candidatus Baltobacteraceae bacterium]|jgi:membrane fusion protein (multidrug efflux system)|nr:efflux RND transporter periplasmic adaptor subunit [Candidatus Baltobacteraceae bacterium]
MHIRPGSFIISAAAAAGLAGCSAGHGTSGNALHVPPPAVQVTQAVQRTVPITAEYVAQTQALQSVDLAPRVEGILEHVYFHNGSLVHKGQTLMQIQQDQYEASVQAAQGGLDKAQADLLRAKSNVQNQTALAKLTQALASLNYQTVQLARMKPLAQKHAVSEEDYDQTKTQYDVAVANVAEARANLQDVELNQRTGVLTAQGNVEEAKAQLTNAQLNLGYTTIASPVTGIISFIKVDEGNVVSPAKTPSLATVSTIDPIKVELQLSESDYLKIASKLPSLRPVANRPKLQFVLSNGSTYPYDGTPVAINRAIDPSTGTISIESTFPNPQALLRPGQFGRVRLPISQQVDAVLIPQSALQSLQGITVVYVVGPGGKLALRTVTPGSTIGTNVIVTSGLRRGEEVVVQGIGRVHAGDVVKPTLVPMAGTV